MIKHFILHEIKKSNRDRNGVFYPSISEVQIDDTANSLIDDLHNAISISPKKVYGIFSQAGTSYFRQELDFYLDNRSYDIFEKSKQFLGDSNSQSLITLINQETLSSGGHIVIIDYKKDNVNYMIIAMINNRLGRAINIVNGVPKLIKTEQIDFQELDLSCRIDIDKYKTQSGIGNYLCFTSGRDNISNYFVKFIGCEKFNQNRDNSRKVVNIINNITKDFVDKEEYRKRAYEYCEARLAAGDTVDLYTMSEFVFGSTERDKIVNEAITQSIDIDHTFSMYRPEMKKFINFKFRGDWIDNLSFDRSHIGSDLVIDSQNNSVILKNVKGLIEEIQNEDR